MKTNQYEELIKERIRELRRVPRYKGKIIRHRSRDGTSRLMTLSYIAALRWALKQYEKCEHHEMPEV